MVRDGLTSALEGEELTQAAHETFNHRITAVTSRQHSVQSRRQKTLILSWLNMIKVNT